jgi:hypothetical protein
VKIARIRNIKDARVLSYVEDRSKDTHIHKNKHDHINSAVDHVYNSVTTLWNSGEREKGKENDTATVILHTTRCEGRGYKNVY